ncbi:hypothetical protein UPYG_G00022020 [Umbra pygmaea]|uniref:Uncharacterized protein n=1 Tax=Umbra pygmaea TaxID=75934 RepID=A0ABD0Y511_UMBPY
MEVKDLNDILGIHIRPLHLWDPLRTTTQAAETAVGWAGFYAKCSHIQFDHDTTTTTRLPSLDMTMLYGGWPVFF